MSFNTPYDTLQHIFDIANQLLSLSITEVKMRFSDILEVNNMSEENNSNEITRIDFLYLDIKISCLFENNPKTNRCFMTSISLNDDKDVDSFTKHITENYNRFLIHGDPFPYWKRENTLVTIKRFDNKQTSVILSQYSYI